MCPRSDSSIVYLCQTFTSDVCMHAIIFAVRQRARFLHQHFTLSLTPSLSQLLQVLFLFLSLTHRIFSSFHCTPQHLPPSLPFSLPHSYAQGVPFVTDIAPDSHSHPHPMESTYTMGPESRPQGLGINAGIGVGVPNLTPWGQKLLLTVYRTYTGYGLI